MGSKHKHADDGHAFRGRGVARDDRGCEFVVSTAAVLWLAAVVMLTATSTAATAFVAPLPKRVVSTVSQRINYICTGICSLVAIVDNNRGEVVVDAVYDELVVARAVVAAGATTTVIGTAAHVIISAVVDAAGVTVVTNTSYDVDAAVDTKVSVPNHERCCV